MTKQSLLDKISRLKRQIADLQKIKDDLAKSRRRLAAANRALAKSNKRLEKLILKDYHTGLFNRRYLEDAIEKELSIARRHSQSFSVIMLDIDYFKAINDAYGHKFGDIVLRHMAQALKKSVRKHDTVIRYGGEEFIIIAPRTDRSTGLLLAQRLLIIINTQNFGDRRHILSLKTSIAVASYPEDGSIMEGMDLIYIADQILRKVKEYGGNRVYSSKNMEKGERRTEEEKEATIDVSSLKGKVERLAKRANQCLVEVVFAFAKTIGLKDRYAPRRIESTARYAEGIAREMGMPRDEIELVRKAAILHDLGKVGIGEEVLRKKAKLSKEEYEMIRKHPQIGADILKPVKFLRDIIPHIQYHHERWDGKGYPSGLKGEEIPLGARIISLVDTYQSLTSNRPYRKSYSEKKALKIIKSGAGKEFDPKTVEAFVRVVEDRR